jgi:hypothetical protein
MPPLPLCSPAWKSTRRHAAPVEVLCCGQCIADALGVDVKELFEE